MTEGRAKALLAVIETELRQPLERYREAFAREAAAVLTARGVNLGEVAQLRAGVIARAQQKELDDVGAVVPPRYWGGNAAAMLGRPGVWAPYLTNEIAASAPVDHRLAAARPAVNLAAARAALRTLIA